VKNDPTYFVVDEGEDINVPATHTYGWVGYRASAGILFIDAWGRKSYIPRDLVLKAAKEFRRANGTNGEKGK